MEIFNFERSVLREDYTIISDKIISYIYQYRDHLGNVRMSYTKNPATGAATVLDNNKYYAFGMNHLNQLEGSLYHPLSVPYNYKYSGKELQETGMYDFGWRHYMPDIGRWNGMDQLSEAYAPISPYSYVANNPVSLVDPDGRKIEPIYDKDGKISGWTFTGTDASLVGGYFAGGGDFGNLTTQLEEYGTDFGSGPVSAFWDRFNSNGVLYSFQRNGWLHWSFTSGGFNGIGNLNTSNHYAKKLHNTDKNEGWMEDFDAGDMVGGIGLMIDGAAYGWNNLSNKKQWRYSYKTHKFLKGRGYNIKTSAIKGSVPKVFKSAGTATLVVGTIMDSYGVYSYYEDSSSPDAVHPAEAGINLAIGVYGMRMNPIFGVFYTVTDILHPQGFWGAWADNVNIHHEFRETNGFPLRIER